MSRTWMWTAVLLLAAAGNPRVPAAPGAAELPTFVVPDLPDLTITTRRVMHYSRSFAEREALYLKGAWQRREQVVEPSPEVEARHSDGYITITRCDERRILQLNEEARTFAWLPIEDPVARLRGSRPVAPPTPSTAAAADVKITIDAVDTGERRQLGHYAARHVVTTRTTDPAPGANTPPSESVEDGWYIDVPPGDCWNWGDRVAVLAGGYVLTGSNAGSLPVPDRVHVEHRGIARRGFPIEETSRFRSHGVTTRTTISLIAYSEARLDKSLFTVPAGYRPALPRIYGGFDLTKPDTLVNRLESYWEELTSWAQRVFRF